MEMNARQIKFYYFYLQPEFKQSELNQIDSLNSGKSACICGSATF